MNRQLSDLATTRAHPSTSVTFNVIGYSEWVASQTTSQLCDVEITHSLHRSQLKPISITCTLSSWYCGAVRTLTFPKVSSTARDATNLRRLQASNRLYRLGIDVSTSLRRAGTDGRGAAAASFHAHETVEIFLVNVDPLRRLSVRPGFVTEIKTVPFAWT
jgi:hypothetical protein